MAQVCDVGSEIEPAEFSLWRTVYWGAKLRWVENEDPQVREREMNMELGEEELGRERS